MYVYMRRIYFRGLLHPRLTASVWWTLQGSSVRTYILIITHENNVIKILLPRLLLRTFAILTWPMRCKHSTTLCFDSTNPPDRAWSRLTPFSVSLSKCLTSKILRILNSSLVRGWWTSRDNNMILLKVVVINVTNMHLATSHIMIMTSTSGFETLVLYW